MADERTSDPLLDEPVVGPSEPSAALDEELPLEEDEPKNRRSLLGAIGLVLAAIIIILILLLLRGCGSDEGKGANTGKGKTINPVSGYDQIDGVVSVWVIPPANVESVFRNAGLRAGATLNMGEGRWVVEVREGDEAKTIAALKQSDGVYDAGRVYEQSGDK